MKRLSKIILSIFCLAILLSPLAVLAADSMIRIVNFPDGSKGFLRFQEPYGWTFQNRDMWISIEMVPTGNFPTAVQPFVSLLKTQPHNEAYGTKLIDATNQLADQAKSDPVTLGEKYQRLVDPSQFTPVLKVKIGNAIPEFETVNCKPGQSCDIGWISKYISILYQYLVGLAAILAAIVILIAGFIWLISAGSQDRIKLAKELITGALSGLALALVSYMLLATVNPSLVANSPVSVTAVTPLSGFGAGADDEIAAASMTGPPAPLSGDKIDKLSQQTRDKVAEYAQYGCYQTSGWRSTGRHSSGQVVDMGYRNDNCNRTIMSLAESVEETSWGTAYHMPDGSVWVDEDISATGGTGRHWHVEFPGNGWEWKPAR